MAQRHRRHQGAVVDLHAVEDLEPLAEPTQDREGVLFVGLVDEDRLEPALEGCVLLDVRAVLVEGGRADHVQLAAGEQRLEHVAGVHRTLGGAGADDGVQLVDEQQDVALGALHLVEHGLQPLLELAAVLRSGDEGPHVQGEDGLVPQALGHVAVGDPLGQTLDDRGLPDPGLADQYRVVLALARQDLDGPADLRVPADHRLELAGRRCRDEVAAVLVQRLVGPLGGRRRHPLVTAHFGQCGQEGVAGQPLSVEEPPGRRARALLHQGDHEVLDRDVLVLEPAGLAVGRVEQPREPLGDVHLPGRHAGPADPRAAAELGLQVLAEPVRIGSRPGEQWRDQALRLGRAVPAAGAPRPPRRGRSAAPWSGRRAEPPATSGSVCSCPWSASSS